MDEQEVVPPNADEENLVDVEDAIYDISYLFNQMSFQFTDMPCFEFDSTVCCMCNGYYGPNNGDPTCETCHAFLFPSAGPNVPPPLTVFKRSEDSDSGNDEPVEPEHPFIIPNYMCILEDDMNPEEAENDLRNQIILYEQIKRAHEQPPPSPPPPPPEVQIHIDELPPEVLMHIFEYLDEMSLWSVGQVSERWKIIVKRVIRTDVWKQFLFGRWPLLYVTLEEQDFYDAYTCVMKGSNCFKCIKQMVVQQQFEIDDNSWRRHRLRTELRAMRLDPLDGIYAIPLDPLCCHWQASIQGPSGSPYEGGVFLLYIQIPYAYPMCPPIVRFLTKILHPNISQHGDIGIDCLHQNWSLALTISKVLLSIQSILTDPYCEVCMEPEIGMLYKENRAKFNEQVRLWTWKYAMHGLKQH